VTDISRDNTEEKMMSELQAEVTC